MKIRKGFTVILSTILAVTFTTVPAAPARAAVTAKVERTAGSGTAGFSDGAADQAAFCFPYGLAINKDGGLIIADSYNNRIRLLKNGQVTTIAGFSDKSDASGFPIGGFADGEALKARFNQPRGAAVDSKGNIYISDTGNNSIRIITEGKVYTFAGTKTAGYKDAKGRAACFNKPSGIAIGSDGSLYVADTLNNVIRRVTSSSEVTTFAGIFSEEGGYLDAAADQALFNEPSDVAVGADGAVYVLDSGNQLIRKIKDGAVSTIAGVSSEKITNTPYFMGGFKNGKAAEAMFNFPMGIDVMEDGTLLIADTWNHRIRMIKPDGSVSTLAGNGVPGLVDSKADTAQFNGPVDVLYDSGTLYISDMWNNCIRSMSFDLKNMQAVIDRDEIANTYQFGEVTDEIQVWFGGSRIGFSDIKPYKEGNQIYVPLIDVLTAMGKKARWIQYHTRVEAKKKGFYMIFKLGVNTVLEKDGQAYITTDALGRLLKLRTEWFPEYNAMVLIE